MDLNNLQRNFEGYLSTPILWRDAGLCGLESYMLKVSSPESFEEYGVENLRLGKIVERFAFHQLAEDDSCTILAENVQIQDGKRTIGELDALLMTEVGPLHLEIVYKFYLFDPSEGATEISHWIGPNKNDTLAQKLNKLKNKQLPLLYHGKTQPLLKQLGLTVTKIKQRVLFKAQLFVPLDAKDVQFDSLNSGCVMGFYVKGDDLYCFKNATFYIPEKRDWLMNAHENVTWLGYREFIFELEIWLENKRSPLCWVKIDDHIEKFFVVWW